MTSPKGEKLLGVIEAEARMRRFEEVICAGAAIDIAVAGLADEGLPEGGFDFGPGRGVSGGSVGCVGWGSGGELNLGGHCERGELE